MTAESAEVEDGAPDGSRTPAGGSSPSSAGGTDGPIREEVLAAASGSDADGTRLDRFLAERSWPHALRLWFGTLAAPYDRSRILRALDRDIAAIDRLLSDQVNAILHHPRLQRLEASWRGLRYLVDIADGVDGVKIRLLSATWAELCRDLERAIEFDQSQLFEKIYSEEFGMPGGEPFGVLIGDYEVQHRRGPDHPTDDVAALKALSNVAAAAFAPVILGCTPQMFGLDSFSELGLPLDLQATFRQREYDRWKGFQESEDARFVGLTVPRLLIRRPHRDDGSRVDGFRFREDVGEGHLWCNAAYAFAAVLIQAFAASGWFADIRGARRDVLGGGIVVGLPVESFETDKPGIAIKYSTDVSISETREKELSDLGFIPLSKAANTEYSVFYGNQSAQLPRRYEDPVASVNARLSTMLQYIMCVSRFAHYIKVIGRDRIGSFTTPEACETFLQNWLHNYCTGNDDASPELKARYPLRAGNVRVREAPGRPGIYHCTVHLQPHFQLDQVLSAFKLVTELAPERA